MGTLEKHLQIFKKVFHFFRLVRCPGAINTCINYLLSDSIFAELMYESDCSRFRLTLFDSIRLFNCTGARKY